MKITFVGQSLSLVVTGSPDAIDVAKQRVAAASSALGGPGVKVGSGDAHSGKLVCQTDASYQGHGYHVVVYSDMANVSPQVCRLLASAT